MYLYIHLRRSRDYFCCMGVNLCISYALHLLILGECAHKRIVNKMKVYIERNNT